MQLAKHDDMVQAVPPNRADQPFRISVLPWRLRRRRPVANAHRSNAPFEDLAINSIPITDDVSRSCGSAIGLRELAGDPFSGWMRGDAQPQDLAATVLQYQQSIEQSERH